MNPPFGTRTKNSDREFLISAFHLASQSVYSLHKKSTREFIYKFSQKYKFIKMIFNIEFRNDHVKSSSVIAELKYDLLHSYKFHK